MREPQVRREPVPHERDDERLTGQPDLPPDSAEPHDTADRQPVDIPDGEGDSDEDATPDEAEPVEGPNPVVAPPLRDSVPAPIGSRPLRRIRGKRSRYQVRRRDIQVPIAPPEDADERDGTWSAMDWKKVLKELNDPNINVAKRRLRRIHLRW